MNHVTWEFFGGINTIGGTIIALECEQHRLIFDLGRLFNPSVPIFDSVLRPRSITDLQRLGLAPQIPGLFAGDGTEAPAGMKTMVAVSHSHLDHVGLLPHLRPDIPLLLTEDTHKLLLALDDIDSEGPGIPLHYLPVVPGSTTTFGPFQITAVLVDHDTPGACAFLIQTPELRFVYSGDLRLHGAHAELTGAFAREAEAFRPDVLFIEGTRAKSEDNRDILQETDVQDRLIEVIRATTTGVYFTSYNRNPERLTAFAEAAKATGRQLVVAASSAYVYEKFGGAVSPFALYGGGADAWSDTLKHWVEASGLPVLEPADLRGQEPNYVVELSYERFVDLVDIEPQTGGCYIHSNGAPLGPFDPAWQNFMFWLERFGLTFHYAGSTGHGSRGDILSILVAIRPRVLMPIHSLTPKWIGLTTVNRILPQYGKVYTAIDLLDAVPPTEEELAEVVATV